MKMLYDSEKLPRRLFRFSAGCKKRAVSAFFCGIDRIILE